MDVFVNYEFYKTEYHGSAIGEGDQFDNLAIRASAFLTRISYGRAKESIPEVKMAACAVIDAFVKYEAREGISSESVGNHSVSYGSSARDGGDLPLESRMYNEAAIYLEDTGLLYRGLD
jgi:hypothetical protein